MDARRSFSLRNGDFLSKGLDTWEAIDPEFEEDDMGGEFLTGYWLRRNGDPKNTCVFFNLVELDIMVANGWQIVASSDG